MGSELGHDEQTAECRHGAQVWRLREGDTPLEFGRAAHIAVGSDPEDREIARIAGTLRFAEGSVWVRSQSRNTIFLRRESGPDLVLDQPGMVVAPAGRSFTILVKGSVMSSYSIDVQVPARDGAASTPSRPVPGHDPTINWRERLTPQEIRRLAALCFFLLTRSGPQARPATWDEAGQLLDCQPAAVRKYVFKLRQKLANLGVPELGAEYDPANPDSSNPKDELALFACRNGLVSAADLDQLTAPEQWR